MDENQEKMLNQVKGEMQYVGAYLDAVDGKDKLTDEYWSLNSKADALKSQRSKTSNQINNIARRLKLGDVGDISKPRLLGSNSSYYGQVDLSESKKIGHGIFATLFVLGAAIAIIYLVITMAVIGQAKENLQTGVIPTPPMSLMIISMLPVYVAWFLVFWLKKHHSMFDKVNHYLPIQPIVNWTRLALLVYSFLFVEIILSGASYTGKGSIIYPILTWGMLAVHLFLPIYAIKRGNQKVDDRFTNERKALNDKNQRQYDKKVQDATEELQGVQQKLTNNLQSLDQVISKVDEQMENVKEHELVKISENIEKIKESLPQAFPMADKYRLTLPYYQLMLEAIQSQQATNWGHANELATDRFVEAQHHTELMEELHHNQEQTMEGLATLGAQMAQNAKQAHDDLTQIDISVQSGFSNVQSDLKDASEQIQASNREVAAAQRESNDIAADTNRTLNEMNDRFKR
ncbi:hypothetical protein [Fructobacillus durionis]|uniref:Methyl-accepting chemotaxis protein n=1 Tax=Fructobacillus durionis TaxID=283737 RepID=A0A1I1G2H8_9LACO|nr:hypothetical protein [Fructobacillus durionis]SFC06039.1 hypothetical protein SAMN05660453_0962 [Fructobacillus durionis]